MIPKDKPLSKRVKRLQMSRKAVEKGKHWTDKDKLKAIAVFTVYGNATKVEEETGIPAGTVNYWKTLPWWFEEMEKLRKSEDQTLISGYTRVVRRTIEQLEDRLENGETMVTKTGEKINRPISARDLSIISGMAADKRMKLVDGVSVESVKQVTMAERLKQLEDQFTRFVTSKVIDGEVMHKVIEIEAPNYKEIANEEGKEGTEEGREERNEDALFYEEKDGEEGRTLQEESFLNA
jgi:hypothetical protein